MNDEKIRAGYAALTNQPGGVSMMGCDAARQNAKGELRDRIHWLRREADSLEALANALPEVLPDRADVALRALLAAAR